MEIRSKRLKIVCFGFDHITEDYITWLNDKQLMQYSEQRHKVHTIETCKSYISSFENTQNMFLAVLNNNRLIGTITIYQDIENNLVDMGILIGDRLSRGQGMASEAWKVTYNWVLKNIKPRKITAGCMSTNIAMIKLMKSIGMELDGIRKKHFVQDNKAVDIIYMAKFNKYVSK